MELEIFQCSYPTVSFRCTVRICFFQFFPRISPRFSFQFLAPFPSSRLFPSDCRFFRSAFRSSRLPSSLRFLPALLELRTYSFCSAFASLNCRPFLPPDLHLSGRSDRFLSSALTGTWVSLSLAPRTFFPATLLPPNLPGSFFPSCFPCRLLRSFPTYQPPCLSSHTLISDCAFLLPDSVPFVPALLCTQPASLPASPLSFSGLQLRPGLPKLHPTISAFCSAFASLTHRASAFPLSLSGFLA